MLVAVQEVGHFGFSTVLETDDINHRPKFRNVGAVDIESLRKPSRVEIAIVDGNALAALDTTLEAQFRMMVVLSNNLAFTDRDDL